MNQNDHMQWRSALVVVVTLLAGCTNGGESGTPNTAPIREETTTVVVATEAPTTSTSAPVTTAVVPSSVAPVDSVPKPVGEDYRVPVVVKFVPSTDAEREVLAAATELLVKYRTMQLRLVGDRGQLSEALVGGALEGFAEASEEFSEDINVPSAVDRVVIESVEIDADEAKVKVCQVDGAQVYVKSSADEAILQNALLATLRKTYQLQKLASGWRISADEITLTTEGADECAKS